MWLAGDTLHNMEVFKILLTILIYLTNDHLYYITKYQCSFVNTKLVSCTYDILLTCIALSVYRRCGS